MIKPKYVVLDIETTGLDPIKDSILEIGAIAIDDAFKNVGAYSAIIRPSMEGYDRLLENAFVFEMHKKNGLLDAIGHGLSLSRVDQNLFDWLTQAFGFQAKEVIISGFSIAFDHGFIKQQMPLTGSLLSHRMLDVSVPLSLFQGLGYPIEKPEMPHRGLPDALLELEVFQKLMAAVAQDREDATKYRKRHEVD